MMMQTPATREAPPFETLYARVREDLDPGAGDVPLDRLMQIFRRLSDLHDSDVSSPLNMGYYCIDSDAASLTAMDETNRRGANVAVRGQHPASAAFEQLAADLVMEAFGIDPARGASHFTSCGTEANHTAMIVALTDQLSHRNPRYCAYDAALCSDEAGREEPYEYWPPRRAAAERAAGALCLAADPRLDREERAQPDRHGLGTHRADRCGPAHGRARARGGDGGGCGLRRIPALYGRGLGRRHALGDHRPVSEDRCALPPLRCLVPRRCALGRDRGVLARPARGLPRRPGGGRFPHLRPAQDARAPRRRRMRHVPLPLARGGRARLQRLGPRGGAAGVRLPLAAGLPRQLGAPGADRGAATGCARAGSSGRRRSARHCAACSGRPAGRSSTARRCR